MKLKKFAVLALMFTTASELNADDFISKSQPMQVEECIRKFLMKNK